MQNGEWLAQAAYYTSAGFATLLTIGLVVLFHRPMLRLMALLLMPLAPLARSTYWLLARTPLRQGALRRYFYDARHRTVAA